MKPSLLRKIVFVYPLLLILCGAGYARYESYQVDGDAISFMDIADAIRSHHFALVPNGYWNPAYAAALSVGEMVSHPSRWNELQTFFWVNFWIFAGCVFVCLYFVQSMVRLRERSDPDSSSPGALSPPALILTSLSILFMSFQRELNLGAVRADALLLLFLMLAAAFLMRLQSGEGFRYYPLLGAALGLAYLTKSFAFLPSGFLLISMFVYGITRKAAERKRILAGVVLTGAIFAAIAGPYIYKISQQRGRLTTGESARLNYAFFIDDAHRWHEWHSGELGHATADFKHHEQLILNAPPVYSYAQHPLGTYPLWFDPAYWTDTLQPKFYLKGHIHRGFRNVALLVRFFVGHLEAFVMVAALLLSGCFFARRRSSWWPLLPVGLWGVLMFGIYFPIDFQDRYLTAPLLLVVLTMLAMVRRPGTGYSGEIATGLAVLLAFLTLANAASDLGDRRRTLSVAGYPRGAYSKEIYPAARSLTALGVGPGQTVACFGDHACYVDQYWARLDGAPIRAEIETPAGMDPGAFWATIPNQQEVIDTLRAQKIAAIVGIFAPSPHIPEGWQQLGDSDFYAYVIKN